MDNLSALIKEKARKQNMGMVKWIEQVYGMKYRSFQYLVQHKSFKYKQIVKLLKLLSISFEDLKEFEYTVDAPPQPQTDNLTDTEKRHKPKKLSSIFGN